MEAEPFEVYGAVKQLLNLQSLLRDMHEPKKQTVILTDIKAVTRTVTNPISTEGKFLALYVHFVKLLIQNNKIKVFHVTRKRYPADLMTK